ncbi:uncharacterized protein [Aegilops tauschii subsp. strangulata]|uniref:uncharacterized protein n=1 Tax=Aegilops tauschii subsp. strangulata TaxID=200361 RepID=UPI003CC8B64F
MAKEMNLSRVKCLGDSDLVAQQVSGKWDSKDPLMGAYRQAVKNIDGQFQGYQVDHIDWRENEAADALSRIGSQRKPVPPNVFLDVLHNPSVKLPLVENLAIPDLEGQSVAVVRAIPEWTMPDLAYLTRGELPEDENLARQITRRFKSMTIVNGKIHRCSVTGVFQRCVSPEEGHEILQEIHAGDMEEFCQREHIRPDVSSVAHAQSNGQAEDANPEILQGIKPRLMDHPNRSIGYTPFFMVYGAEAVLPSDIHHDSPRVAAYVEADNETEF